VIGADFDQALLQARAGGPEAFARLWRDLHPPLLRYLRVFSPGDADDIASETWLQVVKGLGRFTGNEAAFRGWVFTIARHKAVDDARAHARRHELLAAEVPDGMVVDLTDTGGDPVTEVLEHQSTDAALRLIATLPTEQAEVVVLRVVAGFDAAEVATIIGTTPGAVRVASHRGLRQLAHQLEAAGTVTSTLL
jgi:RNA polymerase sigma-70 factor (ECF subfamily)